MKFGEILANLREERGIYQKELAAYLNVSISSVSNYENGVYEPEFATLRQIADFFGVSTDYLLGRTNYLYDTKLLNLPLGKDYTVTDLVNTTLSLSAADQRYLLEYIDYLKLRSGRSENE